MWRGRVETGEVGDKGAGKGLVGVVNRRKVLVERGLGL